MKIARVVGNVVSTVKTSSYNHAKLMLVLPVDEKGQSTGDCIVAADFAQAGMGDYVLVVEEGSSIRDWLKDDHIALDAIIIGVIDEMNKAE